MKTTRYCPDCGTKSQPGDAFCAECGCRLPQEPPALPRSAEAANSTVPQVSSEETSSLGGRLIAGIILVLLIGAIIYVPDWLENRKKDENAQPSWENIRIPPVPHVPEPTGFTNTAPGSDADSPATLEELLVQELVRELGFDEENAREMLKELGTEQAKEVIRKIREDEARQSSDSAGP